MRKLLVVIIGLALFACSQPQDGFKITVKLDGADGNVMLEQRGASQWIGIDTAEVVDGVAVLEGEVDFPGVYYLSVNGERNKAVVFVENTSMSITGKADSIAGIQVSGSASHDEFKTINDKIQKISEEYMAIYQVIVRNWRTLCIKLCKHLAFTVITYQSRSPGCQPAVAILIFNYRQHIIVG